MCDVDVNADVDFNGKKRGANNVKELLAERVWSLDPKRLRTTPGPDVLLF